MLWVAGGSVKTGANFHTMLYRGDARLGAYCGYLQASYMAIREEAI